MALDDADIDRIAARVLDMLEARGSADRDRNARLRRMVEGEKLLGMEEVAEILNRSVNSLKKDRVAWFKSDPDPSYWFSYGGKGYPVIWLSDLVPWVEALAETGSDT